MTTTVRLNLERETETNSFYRKVISTTKTQQLVLMSLEPGVEIGDEVHDDTTQFVRIEAGKCSAVVGGNRYLLKAGDAIVVPEGVRHNFYCSRQSTESVKLYTIYSPPHHAPGTTQKHKC